MKNNAAALLNPITQKQLISINLNFCSSECQHDNFKNTGS